MVECFVFLRPLGLRLSRGGGGPYKIKVRPPCFPLFQGMPRLVKGQMIADLIATLGSVNIIAGELDR